LIIQKGSPLRRIPQILNRQQALFIEAIRCSVDMADVAYRRLRRTLLLLPEMRNEDPETPSAISALLDAWSVVDSLNRLRGVMQHMPGIKGKSKSPTYRAFVHATEKIPTLRNTFQHLETDIHKSGDDPNWAVFGSLSWALVNPERNEITSCIFMPGTVSGSRPMVTPAKREVWHHPVDSVTIERGGIAVCLSDAMRAVAAATQSLERDISKAYLDYIPEEKRGNIFRANAVVTLRAMVKPEQIVVEDDPSLPVPPR
jgi:hypothetical protein